MGNNLLWIDDLRDPDNFIDVSNYDTVTWVKTYDDAMTHIELPFETIHLDNDLSDAEDRQGRHVFDSIEELLYYGNLPIIKRIIIHSDNNSAVRSMMSTKDNFKAKYNVDVIQMIFKFNP